MGVRRKPGVSMNDSMTEFACLGFGERLAFADSAASIAQMSKYVDDLKSLIQEKNEALQQLEYAHFESLTILCRAAEFRDDDTSVHMDRVGALSAQLGRRIGLSEPLAALLGKAAPMHDIGKIAIPDAVLKKPGKYTADERAIMNSHAKIGAEIIGHSEVPLFRLAAEVALTHHECWDGSGYPQGLSGAKIPVSGRVVSIIDFFDALTMDRVYRKALSDELALELLVEQSGKKFDPDMVDVFVTHAPEFARLRDAINDGAQTQLTSTT